MLYKPQQIFKNSKILSLFLLSSFLLPISFLEINKAKAGLEFQWDDNPSFKKLKWYQKNNEKRAKNTIFFFFRPYDRTAALLKIKMTIPKKFQSVIKKDKISFCQVKIGGFETNTKCIKKIPADIEINDDKTSLDIFPYSPILSNKESYAVVFKGSNPRRSGLYQFHSFGQPIGKTLVSSYLGSWTIVID